MSSNLETGGKVEVGPSDITITEKGGVEITNIALSERLKSALASEQGKFVLNICGWNWRCQRDKIE